VKRILMLCVVAVFVVAWGCSKESPTEADSNAATGDDPIAPRVAAVSAHYGVQPTVRSYEVTIENLTPVTGEGSSQPFSPPVLTTHDRKLRLFRRGRYASEELALIAEDAMNAPMIVKLQASNQTFDIVEGDGAIPPGGSATYEIQSTHRARRLSAVFMLVNTNDGFGGLNAVELPRWGERVYYVRAYDAGSEENTELTSDIPGPCCGSHGVRQPTHERIRFHGGIKGVGDLSPDVYGWDEPVARVTIRRINPVYQVTLENMTPATVEGGSQVFSPPLLATHRPGIRMYRVWRYASPELAAIAEEGDTGPMTSLFEASHKTISLVQGDGPVAPGASATYEIQAGGPFSRLSMAFMLVNTNDGFSGVDRLALPVSGSVSYYLDAYDAGSEQNTELTSDIPGPCCGRHNSGPDEHERIKPHPGIQGTGDLDPADWGWDGPVAKLTITRVK
jgi:hypothetical protein